MVSFIVFGWGTVCITRKWPGVDSIYAQIKLQARKMLISYKYYRFSGARIDKCPFNIKHLAYQDCGNKQTIELTAPIRLAPTLSGQWG